VVLIKMRRPLFWFITSAILALICHVGYVLFVPSRSFSAAIDSALGAQQTNQFSILSPEAQVKLLPFASSDSLVGVCKFNVAEGPVKVSAQLSEGFWNFAVYTIGGEQVYAINDTQADTNTFSVELSRDSGLLAQVFGGADDAVDVAGDDIGWRLALKENRGLAILWMAIADPLLRKEAEDVMKQTRCVRVGG
jgi:uncharacterized membrane protein